MKANWDTIFVLSKFGLRWVLLSVEGATGDPAKFSPRGYHEGHSYRSLFQLLFLLTLVDPFPCGGGIKPLQTFRGTPQSLGCSPVTPSPYRTKDSKSNKCKSWDWQYAQVLKWWLALFFEFSLNPQKNWAIWMNHSLRECWRMFARLKNVLEDQQN